MAYAQKNRVALEALTNSLVIALKLKSGAICNKDNLVVGINTNFSECKNTELAPLFLLSGTEDVEFKGVYPSLFANSMIWLTGVLGLLFVLVSFLIIRSTQKSILKNILHPVKEGLLDGHHLEIVEFEEIRLKLDRAKELEKTRAVADAIEMRNKQIAHDIRSPLSALNSIVNQVKNLPESQRLILRNSISRINDIANTLLSKAKDPHPQTDLNLTKVNHEAPKLTVEYLAPLADCLISEKRLLLRDKIGVEIEGDLDYSYGTFSAINSAELQRVLSNLVNNSAESLPDHKGKILVSVRKTQNSVIIKVVDNGKGIPSHILEQLGQMGVTHGKEGTESGSGLGVYHAKKTIESFGGTFEIKSELGNGTHIIMTLPAAPAPKWFVEKLVLQKNMQVISLDDDLSIHQVWKGRFLSKDFASVGSEHLTFTSGQELKDWFATIQEKNHQRLYLMDYELLNQNATGLQIIEELGLGAQSILVTSRYEEAHIREKCERLGVKLIPKAMAGFVPIEIAAPKELLDCILIDDDSLVQMSWKMFADINNKKFKHFFNADDFFKAAGSFDVNIPIYVDSNLGNGVKGEEVSQKIYEAGFKNIRLCTGYEASDFEPRPWIREVVGKDPRFG
jgi:signal transduction histidine kinase